MKLILLGAPGAGKGTQAEIINACLCVLENPEATLYDLMEHISGPDFPTKGLILGRAGIRSMYATGKGRITMRARTELEEFGQNRQRIIVTEIPYQVNKRMLIKSMADQVNEKRLDGISDIRDESDRNGMRIVIELKRDANAQVVLNRLFAQTSLQTTFSANLLALVKNQSQPKVLSLREILDEYLAHQEEVVIRRTRYDLKKAQERAHLLEGLLIAQDNIDEVIRIIRSAYDDAKEKLMERFGLSDVQAQAILDMQLKRLQGLEKDKLQAEYDELEQRIAYYNKVLGDMELVKGIVRDELTVIRDKYGDERRTEIQDVEDEIDDEDLIEEEACCYTLSNAGYIKRLPVDTYRSQRRGGRGISGQTLKDEDYIKNLFIASTHDYLLFFTNLGRVHRRKGYLIPEAGRTAKGTNIVNILPLENGERVTAMLLTREFTNNEYLMMVTRNGTVKRLQLDEAYTARKAGIRVLNLDEGDELIAVMKTSGADNILIATRNGMSICFSEQDVRCMGRMATGVRGIRLSDDDCVVAAAVAEPGKCLLTVTERGYGKRTQIEEYLRGDSVQSRGGKGMRGYRLTEKTGLVAGAAVVSEEDDILLIESGGVVIRMPASGVSVYRRDTQGVIMMRVEDGNRVIAVQRTEASEDEEQTAE